MSQDLVPVLNLRKLKHNLKTQNHGRSGLSLCLLFGFAMRFVALEVFLPYTRLASPCELKDELYLHIGFKTLPNVRQLTMSCPHFHAESKHYLGLVKEKVKVDTSSPSCLEPPSFKSSIKTPIL